VGFFLTQTNQKFKHLKQKRFTKKSQNNLFRGRRHGYLVT
jgi:hypothetical protein